jgi:hypothetical protein
MSNYEWFSVEETWTGRTTKSKNRRVWYGKNMIGFSQAFAYTPAKFDESQVQEATPEVIDVSASSADT